MLLAVLPGALLLGCPQSAAPRRPDAELESYLAHVAAAHGALRLDEPAEMRRWLDAVPASSRGFEWRWLYAQSDQSLRILPIGGEPYALDVSPDLERLAVAGTDGSVVVRSLRDGAELVRMAGHSEATFTVDFDSSGERLLSSSYDRTVKIWNAHGGELLLEFTGHHFPVGGATFSPDGELVASSSYERPGDKVAGTVLVWRSDSGEVVRSLQAGRKPIVDLRFAPDGSRLAAASWDFCVFVWDLLTEEPARTLAVPDEGRYRAVDDLDFSPDGRRVAAVSKDTTARVWDAASGELLLTLRGHGNDVTAVAFSPDGEAIATASADQSLRLWDAADGVPRGVLRGHRARVHDVLFLSDGRLLSASGDGDVREWDGESDWYGGVVRRTSAACYAAAFSPDGRRVATCSYDGRIQQWDSATWEELAAWQAHPSDQSCHTLAWTPDGRRLLSGSYDKTVGIWDAATLEELGRLEHPSGLYFLALSADGRTLAATQGPALWLWDLETRAHSGTLEGHSSSVVDLAFAPDGSRLASAGRDRRVKVWDPAALVERFSIELEAEPSAVAFSPDGAMLAFAVGSELRFVDARDGRDLARTSAGDNDLTRLAWSPDGSRLAGSSAFVPLIDPRVPVLALQLRPLRETGWHLSWNPDGTQLAASAMDGAFSIVDSAPLRARLAARDGALAERARADKRVAGELERGRTLSELAESLWTDAALSPEERGALLDVITLRSRPADR